MSFFADLLGNAALTGEKIVGDKIEQQQRLELEDRQNALAIERQKAIDANRVAAEEKKLQERQARTSQQLQQAEAQAPEISRARQLLEAQGRAPSVDANVLDVIKSKLSPDELKKYYGVKDDAVSRIDDQLTAARKGGMYDAEAALKASRAETVAAIREEWKQRVDETRMDNDSKRADAAERNAETNAKRLEKIASGSGGSGSGSLAKERLEVTKAREARVALDNRIKIVLDKKKEGLMDKKAAQVELFKLEGLRDKYQKIEDGEDAPAAGPTGKTAAPAKKATTSNW